MKTWRKRQLKKIVRKYSNFNLIASSIEFFALAINAYPRQAIMLRQLAKRAEVLAYSKTKQEALEKFCKYKDWLQDEYYQFEVEE